MAVPTCWSAALFARNAEVVESVAVVVLDAANREKLTHTCDEWTSDLAFRCRRVGDEDETERRKVARTCTTKCWSDNEVRSVPASEVFELL